MGLGCRVRLDQFLSKKKTPAALGDQINIKKKMLDVIDFKIRPHRFGGEGVLIGVQSATLNAQVTFVHVAVAVSAFSGGVGLKKFAPKLFPCYCFRFSDVFWGLDLRKVLKWIFGLFSGDFGIGMF